MFGNKKESKKESKKERFVVKLEQFLGMSGFISIIMDSETGVNYIINGNGDSTHITPLLDKDGKVMIDDITTM